MGHRPTKVCYRVSQKKVSLTHSISSDGLEKFFIYPTWVKENCKKISDKNTVCNMVKIHFEKYEKVEKIQSFEIFIAKNNSVTGRL